MRVFIHSTEEIYQGLYGIENFCITEINDIMEAHAIGQEMAWDLISEYGLEDEYYDDEGELLFEPEFNWLIYKIRDDVTDSLEDLNNFIFDEGYEEFIKKYCEEEELY